MKNLTLLLLLLAIHEASALSADIADLPNTVRYKLDMRIDYNSEKIFGLCEITVSNGNDKPLINVPVLLYRLLSVKSVKGGDDNTLNYNQKVISIKGWDKLQVNFVEVSLKDYLLPGEQTTITMAYEGYLLGYVNEGWRYVRDHIGRDFTIIRTDGFDYPVIGYPDEQNMMAVTREQYDYLINITLPEGITPVSGAELITKVRSGDEITYTFRSKKPSWRLDVAIDDYQVYEKNGNKIYYFREDSIPAATTLYSMERTVDLLTGWFGPIKDFKGYTIIEIPEGYSSQKDVTSFNITADNFKNPQGMLSVYHEISHLWNVNPSEKQPCRFESEGFAQFMEFLITEKLDNKEHVVYEAAQMYLERVRKDFRQKPEYQDVPMTEYGIRNMTSYSYTLGMIVFSLFYDLTGQESFNYIIRSFYSTYEGKEATIDDFVNNCKRFAPFNAERLFTDWIYSTNGIKLIIAGKSYDELKDYYRNN